MPVCLPPPVRPGRLSHQPRRGRLTAAAIATVAAVLALCSPAARSGETIAEVLQRSQMQRLQAMPAADPLAVRTQVVQASFTRLLAALPAPLPATLHVVRSGTVAETVHGRLVVAHENLADMPEPMRLFILAHELGHVALRHWDQTTQLYRRWIPGAVRPDTTDPVAGALGREASAQAHQHEYAADGFAARLLRELGVPPADLVHMFRLMGTPFDTATHPGSRKRLAALRALEGD